MSRYPFNKNTVTAYRKELEATGSPSGSSPQYRDFLTAYAAFCRHYESDAPEQIGEEAENELVIRLQHAAATYYNTKTGQQHNETRTKRMNAALKIYDMIDSVVYDKNLSAANRPQAPVEIDMEEERRQFAAKLAAKDTHTVQANNIVNGIMDSKEPIPENQPMFRSLRQKSQELDQISENLEKNDEELAFYEPIMTKTLNHIRKKLLLGVKDDITHLLEVNSGRSPLTQWDTPKLEQWQDEIDEDDVGTRKVSNDALIECALNHLNPEWKSPRNSASDRMYQLIRGNKGLLSSFYSVNLEEWIGELFTEDNKERFSPFVKQVIEGLNRLEVPEEKKQEIQDTIHVLDHFSGTENDLGETVRVLKDLRKNYPNFSVDGANGIDNTIRRMSSAEGDFAEITGHLDPILKIQKKVTAVRDIESQMKDFSDYLSEIQSSSDVQNYRNMQNVLDNMKKTMEMLRETGITNQLDFEYEDFLPASYENDGKLRSKAQKDLTQRIKTFLPDFKFSQRFSTTIPADAFLKSCLNSFTIAPLLERNQNLENSIEQEKTAASDKVRSNINAALRYQNMVQDLSAKVSRLGSSRQKTAILKSLDKIAKQVVVLNNTKSESLIDPAELETIHQNAETLISNGNQDPVLPGLRELGTPAEEYPYCCQADVISKFGSKLDNIMNRLNDATSIFSRDSGEFIEMRNKLKDLQQNIRENPNLLGGNPHQINYNDPEFLQKLNDLKNSAAKYFDAKLLQDKNANRQQRFEIAEEIMNLNGIVEIAAPKETVEAGTPESLMNDCVALDQKRISHSVEDHFSMLKQDTDLIHKTFLRLNSPQHTRKDELQTQKSVVSGMEIVSNILKKEEDGWKTLKDPNASEIKQTLARRDILLAHGIKNSMREYFSHLDGKHTIDQFYQNLGQNNKALNKMKTEILTKQSTADLVQGINAEGRQKDDLVMENFTGAKRLSLPGEDNGPDL